MNLLQWNRESTGKWTGYHGTERGVDGLVIVRERKGK